MTNIEKTWDNGRKGRQLDPFFLIQCVKTKVSSGKRSPRETRSMVDASKCNMLKEVREMVKARKDLLLVQINQFRLSSIPYSTGTSSHPRARAVYLLNEFLN